MGCHPSHWLIFSRWLKPPTSNPFGIFWDWIFAALAGLANLPKLTPVQVFQHLPAFSSFVSNRNRRSEQAKISCPQAIEILHFKIGSSHPKHLQTPACWSWFLSVPPWAAFNGSNGCAAGSLVQSDHSHARLWGFVPSEDGLFSNHCLCQGNAAWRCCEGGRKTLEIGVMDLMSWKIMKSDVQCLKKIVQ